MEAVLKDYGNSFNSLQADSQVGHPIRASRPPFGGGGRGAALCAYSSSVWGWVTCALCCHCSWLDTCLDNSKSGRCCCGCRGVLNSVEAHLRHCFRLPCWLHGGIYISPLGASPNNASILLLFLCVAECLFRVNSAEADLADSLFFCVNNGFGCQREVTLLMN